MYKQHNGRVETVFRGLYKLNFDSDVLEELSCIRVGVVIRDLHDDVIVALSSKGPTSLKR